MSKSNVIHCVVKEFDGVKLWFPKPDQGLRESQPIARKEGDTVEDLRLNPPFFQILPCPWCGVEEDKGHIDKKHLDKRLGVKFTFID